MDSSTIPLDDHDESVRIAASALDDMRNSTVHQIKDAPQSTPTLSSPSSSPSTSSLSDPQGQLNSHTPAIPPSATSPSTSNPTSPDFVSRVSHFPLVKSALRTYEQGKASSRVVKYSAEMVESSVKSISKPVIDRLPVNVNQLDEFACRQLDRFDRYRHPSTGENSPQMVEDAFPSERPKSKTKTVDGSAINDPTTSPRGPIPTTRDKDREWRGEGERSIPSWLEANSPFVAPPPPPPLDSRSSRSSTPTQQGDDAFTSSSKARYNVNSSPENSNERQVVQRSRWQAVLLEASGLSAALSEESMRRLKYCLQWLQYATTHIDAQILILRDFAASLQPLPPGDTGGSNNHTCLISSDHMRKLTAVRRDIIITIRQVVDVVSKYAGGALPEPARTRVRGFILKLPQRWASRAGVINDAGGIGMVAGGQAVEREVVTAAASSGSGVRRVNNRRAAQRERRTGGSDNVSVSGSAGLRSGASSRAASPSASPRVPRAGGIGPYSRHERGDSGSWLGGENNGEGGNAHVARGTAVVAAQRILTLALESLDMMRGVTGVVKDSLGRADAWVGRLRTVGIQRGVREGEENYENEPRRVGSGDKSIPGRHLRRRARRKSEDSSQQMSEGEGYDDDIELDAEEGSTVWEESVPSTPSSKLHGYGYGYGGFSSPNNTYSHSPNHSYSNFNSNTRSQTQSQTYSPAPSSAYMTAQEHEYERENEDDNEQGGKNQTSVSAQMSAPSPAGVDIGSMSIEEGDEAERWRSRREEMDVDIRI